jgi:competence protein ComEC
MRHSLFYPILCGVVLGVGVGDFLPISFLYALSFFGLCAAVIVYSFFTDSVFDKEVLKRYSNFFWCVIFIAATVLGIVRLKSVTELFVHPQNYFHVGDQIFAEGVVVTEPSPGERGVKIIVELRKIIRGKNQSQSQKIEPTKIVVSDFIFSHVEYGDVVSVSGVVEKPASFQTDNGRTFNYEKYLAKDNIHYTLKNPSVTIVGHNQGSKIKKLLYFIKKEYTQKLAELIPYPESSLAAGITVAGKGALPPDVLDDFTRSGTLQVVVLSGFNVTIIAETLITLFAFLPALFSSALGIVSIILFTIMAGGSATVVRGAVMGIVVIIARISGRRYDVGRSLLLAAVVMLWINPLLLLYDPSFQFSFLATFGLIYASPIIIRYLKWVPDVLGIREATAATIASELFVLPLILYSSGEVSLVSVFANTVLFLVIPITMLLVSVAGLVGFLSVTLVLPLAWAAWILLWYELWIVHIFGHFPYAFITVPALPAWSMWLSYICFTVSLYYWNRVSAGMKH